MIFFKLLLFTLTFTLISCDDNSAILVEDKSPVDEVDQVITPISEDKCDNNKAFEGIQSISDITDSSALITWKKDESSIGYSLFEINDKSLKVVSNIDSTQTSFSISNLKEDTPYEFILRTINSKGAYDCNDVSKKIKTIKKQTFISCQEIHEYYQGSKTSGAYVIDTDMEGPLEPIEVYCDLENNDGGWTRVFTHNTIAGFFTDDVEATEINMNDITNDKYSILSKLSQFMREGKYEFWLYYPEHDGVDGGNIWTQISNPVTDLISGYVSSREHYDGMYWGGLEKSSSSGTLIDGSVGSGWWFYAIGANTKWPSDGTIPGPLRNSGIHEVQLFVK